MTAPDAAVLILSRNDTDILPMTSQTRKDLKVTECHSGLDPESRAVLEPPVYVVFPGHLDSGSHPTTRGSSGMTALATSSSRLLNLYQITEAAHAVIAAAAGNQDMKTIRGRPHAVIPAQAVVRQVRQAHCQQAHCRQAHHPACPNSPERGAAESRGAKSNENPVIRDISGCRIESGMTVGDFLRCHQI